MAKREHLDLIKRGAEAIEEWRANNKGVMLDFSYAKLEEANLSGFDLKGAYFFCTNLYYANLSNANLAKADLAFCQLSLANLTGANLSGATLGYSDLRYVTLSNATLFRADLTGATICAPKIEGNPVSLDKSRMRDTILTGCDMAKFSHLDTVKHKGPSRIDLDTLLNSFTNNENFKTTIRPFFVNAGVPKSLLDALPEISTGLEYFSCFVCYGEPDRSFAENLVKNLKAKGVQSWIYSMDSTPGKKVWREITERRQKQDKMIILSSAKSLVRSGVKKELEEQIDEDPEKLIPISLDNIWTQDGFPVVREGRDLKHYLTECTYADFSDETKYEQAINKLLKALKK